MPNRGWMTFVVGLGSALALGWVAFPRLQYRTVEQPLQFSHKVHTSEAVGMTCEDCHSLGEDGRFTGLPSMAACEPCHTEPQGTTAEEKRFVDEYVTKGREVAWLVYARQPENVYFSHAPHVGLAGLECARCHGPHGGTDKLRPYQENRLSSYSRDIWGPSPTRLRRAEWEGMKMTDCSTCHDAHGVRQSCLTCHK